MSFFQFPWAHFLGPRSADRLTTQMKGSSKLFLFRQAKKTWHLPFACSVEVPCDGFAGYNKSQPDAVLLLSGTPGLGFLRTFCILVLYLASWVLAWFHTNPHSDDSGTSR